MNTLAKDFVPYEESQALKGLGFDEPCFGRYNVPGEFILSGCYSDSPLVSILVEQNDICEAHTLAPTFSQAFRWFREKHKLQTYIDFYHSDSYFYKIKSQDGRNIGNIGDIILQGTPLFTRTYEEAELECLVKLIDIVKLKQPTK